MNESPGAQRKVLKVRTGQTLHTLGIFPSLRGRGSLRERLLPSSGGCALTCGKPETRPSRSRRPAGERRRSPPRGRATIFAPCRAGVRAGGRAGVGAPPAREGQIHLRMGESAASSRANSLHANPLQNLGLHASSYFLRGEKKNKKTFFATLIVWGFLVTGEQRFTTRGYLVGYPGDPF